MGEALRLPDFSGSGKSFATPHVTGVTALLITSGVSNNVEPREILRYTATDLGSSGWDRGYGYGLVNAAEAVGVVLPSAIETGPPTTIIQLSGLLGD